MIAVSCAFIVLGCLGFVAFLEWLKFQKELKTPKSVAELPSVVIEDLRADINRIKLMLNIRTFKAEGEKK